jgi:DNA-binding response OmpR family regulator
MKVTETTAAQNMAMALHNSRDPRALHGFLDKWKAGQYPATTDYILSLVQYFNDLHEHSIRPDRTLGELTLQFNYRRACWEGVDIGLTLTEFKVVDLMIENVGNFLSYRAIYDVVHYAGFAAGGGIEGYKTNVRSIVKRLRRKFEKLDPLWNQIENYNGYGYRWIKPESNATKPALIVTPSAVVLVPA